MNLPNRGLRRRKMPDVDSEGAISFSELWDKGTHEDKLALCRSLEITYAYGRNYRSACKVNDLPPVYTEVKSASWEEHIRVFREMDALTARQQKVPSEITINIDTQKPIGIAFDCDWHLGAFGVDYESFERNIGMICNEEGLLDYVGGDTHENMIQPSKMGSSHNQIPIPNQKALVWLTIKKLQKTNSLLAIGTGNHDYFSALMEGEDWMAELARRIKTVYTKHGGMIYLKVGDMIYPIWRMHKGRFNSSFNLTHSPKQHQRLEHPDARIIVVEHQHMAAVEQYLYNERECVAIRPGTYSVYSDFAMQNGYWGAHVAVPIVVLYPYEDKIVPFKDLEAGVEFLRAVRS